MSQLPPQPDVGPRVVARIHERLLIDEPWTTRGERGFTWIGHRLAQTVTADPPIERDGFVLAQLVAETTVVDDVRAPRDRVEETLGALNAFAVGSAYVFSPERRAVRLVLGQPVHAQTCDSRAEELAGYAILQLCEAEGRAERLATAVAGRVAARAHPAQGVRRTPDEMLNVVPALFGPAGRAPSRFADEGEMQRVADHCRDSPAASLGGWRDGVTVEVPCGADGTSLIELRADVAHPWLGSGLAVRTTLPLPIPEPELPGSAARLQAAQLVTTEGGGQVGAWHVGRHQEMPYLAWTRFVPNQLFAPGAALAVAVGEMARAVWADCLFHGELPPRSAWTIMLAREEARRQAGRAGARGPLS